MLVGRHLLLVLFHLLHYKISNCGGGGEGDIKYGYDLEKEFVFLTIIKNYRKRCWW